MRSDRQHSFKTLYATHSRAMYWVAMGLCADPDLAEDAVQDVFIKLWEEQIDPAAIDKPYSYLSVRVRNQIYDKMRHQSVIQRHEAPILYEMESEALEDLSEEELNEKISKAWALVNSLPEASREIFLMATIEGLKYEEIAERRGISINTVKTQLRLARKRLKEDRIPTIILYLSLFHILS